MRGRLALVALALTAFTACARNTATFVLSNDSKDPIRSAVVEATGSVVELGRIEPGKSATGVLEVSGDGEYHITVRFQSGRVLDRRMGYVTSGFDFGVEFSVSEADIVLKKSEASKSY